MCMTESKSLRLVLKLGTRTLIEATMGSIKYIPSNHLHVQSEHYKHLEKV